VANGPVQTAAERNGGTHHRAGARKDRWENRREGLQQDSWFDLGGRPYQYGEGADISSKSEDI